ncbi:unnamed protein product [Closterium sp. NIES-53]
MYLMTCTRPDLAFPLSLLARYVAPVRRAWGSCLEDGLELSSLVTLTLPGLTTWLRSGCHRVTPSAFAPVLSLGGLPALLLFLAPIVRLRSTLGPWLHKSYAGPTADRIGRGALFSSSSQRGKLRLAYVASQANTADVFTKALQPCDHQRFCTVLGLVPTMPHLLTS